MSKYRDDIPHECRCEVCGKDVHEIRQGYVAADDVKLLLDAIGLFLDFQAKYPDLFPHRQFPPRQ